MGGVDVPQPPRQRGLIRQWRLVRALQAARMGLTFDQLREAAEDAVHLRTIRRDVDTLTFAGFPIDVVTGDSMGGTRVRLLDRSIH